MGIASRDAAELSRCVQMGDGIAVEPDNLGPSSAFGSTLRVHNNRKYLHAVVRAVIEPSHAFGLSPKGIGARLRGFAERIDGRLQSGCIE